MDEQSGFVTIVVPVLNEAGYIAACVDSLLAQWPRGQFEILALDGGSSDATPAILRRISQRSPEVRLVHNPGRTQAAAMNLAARIADPRATVLIRADAHALYPPDFVRLCMAAMGANNATSVVVPMKTVARPGAAMQQAIKQEEGSTVLHLRHQNILFPKKIIIQHLVLLKPCKILISLFGTMPLLPYKIWEQQPFRHLKNIGQQHKIPAWVQGPFGRL